MRSFSMSLRMGFCSVGDEAARAGAYSWVRRVVRGRHWYVSCKKSVDCEWLVRDFGSGIGEGTGIPLHVGNMIR